jgi:hypothetical protein
MASLPNREIVATIIVPWRTGDTQRRVSTHERAAAGLVSRLRP